MIALHGRSRFFNLPLITPVYTNGWEHSTKAEMKESKVMVLAKIH